MQAFGSGFQRLVYRVLERDALAPADSGLRIHGYRQKEFEEALLLVIKSDRLALVKLLSEYFRGFYVTSTVVTEAARLGRARFCGGWWTTAVTCGGGGPSDCGRAGRPLRAGQEDEAESGDGVAVIDGGVDGDFSKKWEPRDVEVGRGLSGKVTNPLAAVQGSVDGGHLEVVKSLMDQVDVDGLDASRVSFDLDRAAENGHADVMNWVVKNHADRCCIQDGDCSAARDGRLDTIQLLYTHNIKGCTDRAFIDAADAGHLDIVTWMHDHRGKQGAFSQPG